MNQQPCLLPSSSKFDEYNYHKDSRNTKIFRCRKKGKPIYCRRKIVIIDEDLNLDHKKIVPHHGHEQDLNFMQKLAFKREIFRRGQETTDDLADIWHGMMVD
ncbi:hypothetical protein TKK_0000266 [Trichogramma kaykai]